MLGTLSIIISGGVGAFVGSASGEICSKSWEETRAVREKMGNGQIALGVVVVASVALCVVAAGAVVLRRLGYSNSQILALAGGAVGDMMGVGIAFAIPYVGGVVIRKILQRLKGPAPQLIEDHFKAWNEGKTQAERENSKEKIILELAKLPSAVARKVKEGLKERNIDLDSHDETNVEFDLWLSAHPMEWGRLFRELRN